MGQQDTGNEVTLNALYDRYSMSLGQFYYRTDGFRNNNDLKKEMYNLFASGEPDLSDERAGGRRYTDERYGDRSLRFNPDLTDETLRTTARTRYARFGFRHPFAPGSDILISLSYLGVDDGLSFSDPYFNYYADYKTAR